MEGEKKRSEFGCPVLMLAVIVVALVWWGGNSISGWLNREEASRIAKFRTQQKHQRPVALPPPVIKNVPAKPNPKWNKYRYLNVGHIGELEVTVSPGFQIYVETNDRTPDSYSMTEEPQGASRTRRFEVIGTGAVGDKQGLSLEIRDQRFVIDSLPKVARLTVKVRWGSGTSRLSETTVREYDIDEVTGMADAVIQIVPYPWQGNRMIFSLVPGETIPWQVTDKYEPGFEPVPETDEISPPGLVYTI